MHSKTENNLLIYERMIFMKKFLSLILIIILCCSFSACSSPASSPIEDFEYELKDGEATIIGYTGTDLEIVVPDTIEGRPVIYIGYNEDEKKGTFEGYDMTSVVIPDGVKFISEYAFKDCKMLENISLPDTLKGFYYNEKSKYPTSAISGLEYTKWYQNQSDGIMYIDNVCLGTKGDLNTNEVEIKNGTATILGYAFDHQDNITNVIIPNSVKYIGENAFQGCDLLKELNVPDGVVVDGRIFEGIINGKIVQETTVG